MMIKNTSYTKTELRGMLTKVFAQHPDQPTFLILSDTNVFFDNAVGRKLATDHARKFNARIFRFSNPHYAEGNHASTAIIEDGDNERQAAPAPKQASEPQATDEKASEAKSKPAAEEVTNEVAAQVAAEQKKAEASKVAAAKATGSKSGSNSGVKAKR